jgi:chorismate mutase/prephenate dehydratase
MDESFQAKLLPLRQRIDQIDAEILDLLNQRARTAQEVGELKHAFNAQGPVLRPEREAQVIRQLQTLNRGPLPTEAVSSVWTEIISACRGLEQSLTVAFLVQSPTTTSTKS